MHVIKDGMKTMKSAKWFLSFELYSNKINYSFAALNKTFNSTSTVNQEFNLRANN